MQADIRQQLSAVLAPISEDHARMVADPLTQIEVYPTPFFKQYHIYRVEYLNPHKPVLFYVGFAPGKPAYLLTGMAENYVKLAQANAVVIDTPEIAVSYVTTYLEVTRSMSQSFYLVRSVDEVRFHPNLTPEETRAKESFREQYRTVITTPTVRPVGEHAYIVTVFAVHGQSLERYDIEVSKKGNIQGTASTLERDLPLVYGL